MPFAVSSSENNRVRVFVRAYQESTDRSWEVIDTYSSGTGYVTNPLDLPSSIERDCAIDITLGYPNLGELISTQFEFCGEFTAAEKEIVEWTWEQSRQFSDNTDLRRYALFQEQNWYISNPKMVISAPFVIEKLDLQRKWLDTIRSSAYNTISN
jgi:hypothetical protein